MNRITGKRGFTLIELLVVIAIIALLISLLLPSLGATRKTARGVICQSNLRQFGIAIQAYLDDQKDPKFMDLNSPPPGVNGPNALLWQISAVFALRPYMGGTESNKPYTCPSAEGDTSVRTHEMAVYLGRRIYSLPWPDVIINNAEPTIWSGPTSSWRPASGRPRKPAASGWPPSRPRPERHGRPEGRPRVKVRKGSALLFGTLLRAVLAVLAGGLVLLAALHLAGGLGGLLVVGEGDRGETGDQGQGDELLHGASPMESRPAHRTPLLG